MDTFKYLEDGIRKHAVKFKMVSWISTTQLVDFVLPISTIDATALHTLSVDSPH